MSVFDKQVSTFDGVKNSAPVQTMTLWQVLTDIHDGHYRHQIEHLRHLKATRGVGPYTAAKGRLGSVTFCGTFAPTRAKGNLVLHSGIVHGDIDHLTDAAAVKRALCADAYIVYCFTSPGGDGLKLGVSVASVENDAAYKLAWQAVSDYVQQQYAVRWDPSGKDISRLCFVSWDPELYVNPGATCFTVREPPGHPADNICTVCQDAQGLHHSVGADRKWRAVGAHHREWYARQAVAIAVKMLDASTEGARHAARTKAACLLGGYVGGGILTYAAAIAGLAPAVRRNTTNLPEAMQTIEDCLKAGIQAPITFEALEHARRAWKGRHWLSRPRVWTGSFATIDAGEVLPWHE